MFLSINAPRHFQLRSKGCSHLQNAWQPHYHAAQSVLTSRCSLIGQQIWDKILIALVILGICFKIQILNIGKWSMYTHISGWHIFHFGTIGSLNVTGWLLWGRSCSGWRWRWFRRRCPNPFVPPRCLQTLRCAIVARQSAIRQIVMNHSQVSSQCSLHHYMPIRLASPHYLFSDFGAWLLDEVWRFLNCGAQKPSFDHFGHIQCNAHVRLFYLYPASLPCHSSRHVKTLQEISCWFRIWDSDITSTIYSSVASSKLFISILFTLGDAYHEIWVRTPQSWQHHDVLLCGLWRQMPSSTMKDSHYGQ